MNKKTDIRSLTLEEIITFCTEHNLPKFRAKQIWEWLWKKRIQKFEKMTSLPQDLHKLLNSHFIIKTSSSCFCSF